MSGKGSGQGPMTLPPGSDATSPRSPADLIELSKGQSAAHAWGVDDLAAMWRHQLDTSLKSEVKALVDRAELSPELSFAHLLLREPNPPVDYLRAVKDYAKALERDPHRPLPDEIVWLLYLVAVCAADVRCGTRISSTSPEALAQWVTWAVAQTWADEESRALVSSWRLGS
jgi:hypothetical protein